MTCGKHLPADCRNYCKAGEKILALQYPFGKKSKNFFFKKYK
jgi:hypothetical protein